MVVDEPELKDEDSYMLHVPELRSGKDRRNEVEHIGINRSTDERRRRFSVFKV